jgi:hypothetical protein
MAVYYVIKRTSNRQRIWRFFAKYFLVAVLLYCKSIGIARAFCVFSKSFFFRLPSGAQAELSTAAREHYRERVPDVTSLWRIQREKKKRPASALDTSRLICRMADYLNSTFAPTSSS